MMTSKEIILIVVPKAKYLSSIRNIIETTDKDSNRICYGCFNKPYKNVIKTIEESGLDSKKYFFIDVLTSSVTSPKGADNCEFIQSPNALTDISLAFSRAIHDEGCDNAIFDAISTLTIYQDIGEIIKFTQNMMTKARVENVGSVYIALKEDSEELVKDLSMFVDKVIE